VRSHISNLTTHLKALKQKEAKTSKRSRWQEIIKLRAEINKIEIKITIQKKINGAKS
jgi:AmiR/NasT family two-component response regulator